MGWKFWKLMIDDGAVGQHPHGDGEGAGPGHPRVEEGLLEDVQPLDDDEDDVEVLS